MNFNVQRGSVALVVLLTLFILEFNSCLQTTQLNALKIDPLDTAHYTFATITIHGALCTIHRHTIDGYSPYGQISDTSYSSIINRSDTLFAPPSKFLNDTMLLWDHIQYEEDSVRWQFRFVLDSSHARFSSVSWLRDSGGWDFIFDHWSKRNCDTIFDIPLTRLQDGSLTGHLAHYHRIGVFSDSEAYSDGFGFHNISKSEVSLDSVSADAYIDVRIGP